MRVNIVKSERMFNFLLDDTKQIRIPKTCMTQALKDRNIMTPPTESRANMRSHYAVLYIYIHTHQYTTYIIGVYLYRCFGWANGPGNCVHGPPNLVPWTFPWFLPSAVSKEIEVPSLPMDLMSAKNGKFPNFNENLRI